jgi:hypothetical protein
MTLLDLPEREDEVEKVEAGETDEELVEIGSHLGAREHIDGKNIA